ncbi:MAG: response regulator NasT [Cryomorphaceae bacterium]|jgi:response regulator NasT
MSDENKAVNPLQISPPSILATRKALFLEVDGLRPAVSLMDDFAGQDLRLTAVLESPTKLAALVAATKPSVLVLSVDFLDAVTLDQLSKIHLACPLPVIVFASQHAPEVLDVVVRVGVSSYVVDGISIQRLPTIIDLAIARFEQTRVLSQELARISAKLMERKLVERAKGIIMQQRNISEDQAYKEMRKSAMDRATPMAEISKQVISIFEMRG